MDNCRLRICPGVRGHQQGLGKHLAHFLARKILMVARAIFVDLCLMQRMAVLAGQKILIGKHCNQAKTGGVVSIQVVVRSRRNRHILVAEVLGDVAVEAEAEAVSAEVVVSAVERIHLTETECFSSNKDEILFKVNKSLGQS